MRRWILNIHLYGGLLCAPYLIIFGVSALLFNHPFAWVAPTSAPLKWEQAIKIEPAKDNATMANSVRDSLGLMGWPVLWKMKRDASGDVHFDIERPGKSYTVHTVLAEGKVRVEERRKTFWQVVRSLHALGALPNSRFVSWWGVYTEVCIGFTLFAGISGVYLWVVTRRERAVGMITLCAAVLLSSGLMLYVVLRG